MFLQENDSDPEYDEKEVEVEESSDEESGGSEDQGSEGDEGEEGEEEYEDEEEPVKKRPKVKSQSVGSKSGQKHSGRAGILEKTNHVFIPKLIIIFFSEQQARYAPV